MTYKTLITRYPQTRAEALNIAQSVLTELDTLAVPANPIHFLLIYEWLTKFDELIYEDVNQAIQFKAYNQESAMQIFNETLTRIARDQLPSDDFTHLLADLSKKMDHWIQSTESSQTRIESNLDNLVANCQTPDAISILKDRILPEITQFKEQSQLLRDFVANTTKEVNRLHHELENMTRISVTDELTNIPNRRGFNQAITKIIEQAQTTQTGFALFMIDIDFFKQINDTYGHLVGDSVLRYLAKFLYRQIKGMDLIARIGGEEFILVLPDTTYSDALKVANNLRSKVAASHLKIAKKSQPIDLKISIGVAVYQMGEPIETLVDRADKALYLAKTTGRNKVCGEAEL